MGDETAQTIELSRFRVREGQARQFIEDWPVLRAALRQHFAGFIDAHLARMDDGTWVFVGYWASLEACRRAMADAMDVPAIGAWLALIDGEAPLELGDLVTGMAVAGATR